MSTIRVAKRRRFTSVAREAINDDRLSYRARGVLVWLLDKPDDWRCDSEQIAAGGKEGRDAVRAALNELEEAGYLHRRKVQGDGGRWLTETLVYEAPTDAWKSGPGEGPPVPGKPTPGKPTVGEPVPLPMTVTEDCDLKSTRAPAESPITFDTFWQAYPKRVGKGAARPAWDKAVKKAEPELIVTGAIRYANEKRGTEPRYVAHPATWLNQQRWTDEPGANRDGRAPAGALARIEDDDRPSGKVDPGEL